MAQSQHTSPASIRNIWVGPGLGLVIGLATGAVSGWLHVREHLYLAYGLTGLAWASILRITERHVLYAVALLAALHLLALLVAGTRRLGSRWPGLGAALLVGLVLAGGVLAPLNQAGWFPGSRSAAGLGLNGAIVGLCAFATLLAVWRGGPASLAGWLAAPRLRRPALLALSLGVLCLASLHIPAWTHRGIPREGAPNVVLISIDTLRYDHLSMNGYARRTTPNLDALAGEAMRFTQATTPRPKTTPSVVSMLTGLYPHTSGVRRLVDHLHPRNVTMAEVFRNAGYRTGAVITNCVLNADGTGLGAGFDFYHDATPEFGGTQLDSAPATDIAIDWLRAQGDAPAFLWLHYMDPHGPYASPSPYNEAFVSESRGTRHAPLDEIPEASRLGDETDIDYYIDQYDGEILYTDHHLKRLLDDLEARGLGDRTILVVTADHGESLGEHDYYFEHGLYVYDDCSHIPLIVRLPGGRAGVAIDAPVELIDLHPTLLDLAGLRCPVPVDGTSLRPLLEGAPSPRPQVAFIERYTMLKAVRSPHWKVIHTYGEDGSIVDRELYDLVRDPGEEHDLFVADAPQVSELEPVLLSWTDTDPIMALRPGIEREGEDATPDVIDKLRALGYVD